MEKTKFNQNQSVFKVGEIPDKMYLLVKGSVGIFLSPHLVYTQVSFTFGMVVIQKWVWGKSRNFCRKSAEQTPCIPAPITPIEDLELVYTLINLI